MAHGYDAGSGYYKDLVGSDGLTTITGHNAMAHSLIRPDQVVLSGDEENKMIYQIEQAREVDPNLILMQRRSARSRRLPIGFVSEEITDVGTTANLSAKPQYLFRGEELICESWEAQNFAIRSLQVGTVNQLLDGESIPMQAFSEASLRATMRLDTCDVGQNIIISLEKIRGGGEPSRFRATMIGATAR